MIKFLEWHLDEWFSRQGSFLPHDKLEHFLLALIGMAVFLLMFKWSLRKSVLIAVLLSIGWEIKDGVFPYDWQLGLIQGFSWKDLVADVAGISLGGMFAWQRQKVAGTERG